MTEDFIEQYDTFNTKSCPEDLIFGGFNNQPIPSNYYDIRNDSDDYGTPIDVALAYNKRVEDAVVSNYENKDDNSLASDIDPPQKTFWKLNEWIKWSMKLKKDKLKKWNLKIK